MDYDSDDDEYDRPEIQSERDAVVWLLDQRLEQTEYCLDEILGSSELNDDADVNAPNAGVDMNNADANAGGEVENLNPPVGNSDSALETSQINTVVEVPQEDEDVGGEIENPNPNPLIGNSESPPETLQINTAAEVLQEDEDAGGEMRHPNPAEVHVEDEYYDGIFLHLDESGNLQVNFDDDEIFEHVDEAGNVEVNFDEMLGQEDPDDPSLHELTQIKMVESFNEAEDIQINFGKLVEKEGMADVNEDEPPSYDDETQEPRKGDDDDKH